MKNFRVYGKSPFSVVVVHGGPGASGEMKPVAEELSKSFGVIEPLQTADSIKGQIEELKKVIEENATSPVFLIGWSWGAWLSYLLAARYPYLVKKLIVVSSGPFEAGYAQEIMNTRLNRLTGQEKERVNELIQLIKAGKASSVTFNEFGSLMDKADSYNSISAKDDYVEKFDFQPKIYENIWSEAEELRKSGKLLDLGNTISSPVIAIHGDYDPHPAEGVKIPLSRVIKNFKFYLLEHCGHNPWREKDAVNKFYELLSRELRG